MMEKVVIFKNWQGNHILMWRKINLDLILHFYPFCKKLPIRTLLFLKAGIKSFTSCHLFSSSGVESSIRLWKRLSLFWENHKNGSFYLHKCRTNTHLLLSEEIEVSRKLTTLGFLAGVCPFGIRGEKYISVS